MNNTNNTAHTDLPNVDLRRSRRLRHRQNKERLFRFCVTGAVVTALIGLVVILSVLVANGIGGFYRTVVTLDVYFDKEYLHLDTTSSSEDLYNANFVGLVKNSFKSLFPDVTERGHQRDLTSLLSTKAEVVLREMVMRDLTVLGTTRTLVVPLSSKIDQLHKGYIKQGLAESQRVVSDRQLAYYKRLCDMGRISSAFNIDFFKRADSTVPEAAGIAGGVMGSLYTLLVCFAFSFPIGIATAVYLEEFAPKNRLTDFIEININNLASVPSIIFGLLGLAVFCNVLGVPRGTSLVYGMVLSLMTLPIIIIACRVSLKAVPSSIKMGAIALGASPIQVVLHHVLPLAMPGTFTGTIIGLARALGETAPLLLIGALAFNTQIPLSPTDFSTPLPAQIYLWVERPERGFEEKASVAILVVLAFLICMNMVAVWLRHKFERRW